MGLSLLCLPVAVSGCGENNLPPPPARIPASPARGANSVAQSALPPTAVEAATIEQGPLLAEVDSLGNLQRIASAMAAYRDKEHHFPAAALYAKDKPVLSWRVALLPYLGENDLYQQFNLQEPWNSPHNRPLIARIPSCFRNFGGPPDGKTCYLVVTGEGTIFGQREGLAGGPSGDAGDQIVLVVEADADRAVDWTRPTDLHYASAQPAMGLGKLRGGSFLVALANGTAQSVVIAPNGANQAAIGGLFTAKGHAPADKVELAQRIAGLPTFVPTKPDSPVAAVEPAPTAPSPTAAATVAELPAATISKRQTAALDAIAQGNQKRGLTLLAAEAVLGNEEVLNSLRRSPALARPRFVLRCGVAVHIPGLPTSAEIAIARNQGRVIVSRPPSPAVVEALGYWAQAVGRPLLDNLQARMGEGKFGKWLQLAKASNAGVSIAPPADQAAAPQYTDEGGILNLGIMDAAQARRLAVKEGLDVLIVAVLTGKAVKVRGGFQPQSTLAISVVDVGSNNTLLKVKPVDSPVAGSNPPPSEPDARTGLDMVNDVVTFFEEKLFLVDLPSLTPQDARQRADSLTEQPPAAPLAALAELRYYQYKNLLTPTQLSSYFAKLLGDEDGPRLAEGREGIQRQIIDGLLTPKFEGPPMARP